MIPKKIEKKLKEKCGDNKFAFDAIFQLLEYEESGKGRQNKNCEEVIEKYVEDLDHENKIY